MLLRLFFFLLKIHTRSLQTIFSSPPEQRGHALLRFYPLPGILHKKGQILVSGGKEIFSGEVKSRFRGGRGEKKIARGKIFAPLLAKFGKLPLPDSDIYVGYSSRFTYWETSLFTLDLCTSI